MAKKKFKVGTVKNQEVFCGGQKYPISNGTFEDGEVKFKTVIKNIGIKPNGTYKNKLYAEIL